MKYLPDDLLRRVAGIAAASCVSAAEAGILASTCRMFCAEVLRRRPAARCSAQLSSLRGGPSGFFLSVTGRCCSAVVEVGPVSGGGGLSGFIEGVCGMRPGNYPDGSPRLVRVAGREGLRLLSESAVNKACAWGTSSLEIMTGRGGTPSDLSGFLPLLGGWRCLMYLDLSGFKLDSMYVGGVLSEALRGTRITFLGLDGCPCAEGMRPLAGAIPGLESLSLSGAGLTASSARDLAGFTRLESLDCSWNPCVEGFYSSLVESLPGLRHLDCSYPRGSPSGIGELGRLSELETLRASCCGLVDADVAELCRPPLMNSLDLSGNQITDRIFHLLSGDTLSRLQDLDLSVNSLTPRCAVLLAGTTRRLRRVDLRFNLMTAEECDSVTEVLLRGPTPSPPAGSVASSDPPPHTGSTLVEGGAPRLPSCLSLQHRRRHFPRPACLP